MQEGVLVAVAQRHEAELFGQVEPDDCSCLSQAPRLTALSSERGLIMLSFESAVSRYFSKCEVDWKAQRFLDAVE
jgi:hypothetical protein